MVMTDMTHPTLAAKKVAINIDSLDSGVTRGVLDLVFHKIYIGKLRIFPEICVEGRHEIHPPLGDIGVSYASESGLRSLH